MNQDFQKILNDRGRQSADLVLTSLALALTHKDHEDPAGALSGVLTAMKQDWREKLLSAAGLLPDELVAAGLTDSAYLGQMADAFDAQIDSALELTSAMLIAIGDEGPAAT